MDNYQLYLLARVWIFKSSRQDSSLVLFILSVHLSVSEIETLMVAPLVMVTLMMSLFPSTPAWFVDLTLAERFNLLQVLQAPYLPPIHSFETDPSSFG